MRFLFVTISLLILCPWTTYARDPLSERFDMARQAYERCFDSLPVKARLALTRATKRGREGRWSRETMRKTKECLQKRLLMEDAESIVSLRDDLEGLLKGSGQIDMSKAAAEAAELAVILVDTTREMNEDFQMAPSALWQNFLIKIGVKSGGYCYQWTAGLFRAMPRDKYRYFERHWGVHNRGKVTENNAVIITPRGAPLDAGIVYDPWRGKGRPFWRPVANDSQDWSERYTENEIISHEM